MEAVYVSLLSPVASAIYIICFLNLLYRACVEAYNIRLYAINEYGRVIHEFDPYFNYRAAEYLWANGSARFFKWFDYMSWYPLGRPVGTTIYPGMQFTSVWIKQFILPDWSINDICCFVPCWFGVAATLATAALCYTAVQSSAVFTALIMAVVPAHLLRSVGGGYDNESVATTAMQLTFWFWTWTVSSKNTTRATILGVVTGFMYFYMVAAWGGYVFVINLVGIHALFVLLLRKVPFNHLYCSYTSFYAVGTLLAMQIPVVGLTPIKSIEQLGPFGVFVGLQALQLMLVSERKFPKVNKWKVRGMVCLAAAIVAMPVVFWLHSSGYFGPISSRVRGLFVKHTKTGNPLVDSVAEHQAASKEAYFQYLNIICYLAPIGFGIVAMIGCTPASSFLIVYGLAAYFFSLKMVRLILLAAPIASICGGIFLGYFWAWSIGGIFGEAQVKRSDPLWVRAIRLGVGAYFIKYSLPKANEFKQMCHQIAKQISHPTIITKGQNRQTGETVVVDDYREAYFWLRDKTPEDARIMAWWDYGYQITGIGNRTTIADGNTWNHEHIALLGRILTGPEKDAHRIARHLADYVLVWAGGGGDDLAKSPHLKRIANSVYRGLCSEPTCRDFSMRRGGIPSEQLSDSLLYKLHSNGIVSGVQADPNRWKEVFRSKYGKVRIYKILSVSKESKEWVENNRVCDAPGSWYCPGQYPPALEKILAERKDFAQLEDFNTKSEDSEYQKQYFENLNNKGSRAASQPSQAELAKKQAGFKKLPDETIDELNKKWDDNEKTSMMWEIIKNSERDEFMSVLSTNPELAHMRSKDGRGPIFWAHEYGRSGMIQVLRKLGVSEERGDVNGVKPTEITHSSIKGSI
ncbi:putative oligosaccharyl transferase [Fragilariopsis cylindrus CCMP1102]|uniref:dolichyl-diphosphooligosaccharide--protein glycotransferase n=1 Tax=Fragilariopsis cylindrus CCMP1102 TaxID=635003 RepID=A0A1E7FDF1_9STRA|nr:putative oligosaccharyl transferase [Fragilariopsis cylindrus CCMP1102]|eukprot:OEU16208.1 putative oligosaccharyl transferase [Fragilariopsis cylindrus CCMP1102]